MGNSFLDCWCHHWNYFFLWWAAFKHQILSKVSTVHNSIISVSVLTSSHLQLQKHCKKFHFRPHPHFSFQFLSRSNKKDDVEGGEEEIEKKNDDKDENETFYDALEVVDEVKNEVKTETEIKRRFSISGAKEKVVKIAEVAGPVVLKAAVQALCSKNSEKKVQFWFK